VVQIAGMLGHSLSWRLAGGKWSVAERKASEEVRERVRLALEHRIAPDARTALLIRDFTGRTRVFPTFPSGSFSRDERSSIDAFQGGRRLEAHRWRALHEVVSDPAINPKISGTIRAIETAMHRSGGGGEGGGGF